MKKHNFAFVDIELTGLNFLEHEIIEIGCVITTPSLEVIEEFELKIKPEHIENANPASMKINHYDPVIWENAYNPEEAIKIFLEKTKDCIMVGHNVSFDVLFLEYAFKKFGLSSSMHYHRFDTLSMAWAKLHRDPSFEHFSLRELCERFGIKNERPHSALSDARAAFELYKKLMEL